MGYILAIVLSGLTVGACVFLFNRKTVAGMRSALELEKENRIAAEQRVLRIPELETELKDRETLIGQLRNEAESLKVEASKLKVTLEQQAKSIEDQKKLLDDAKARLSDSFKALSAEALKSNSDQFLKLAQQNLEKFQTEAKGDLKRRQQAIDDLVKPMKESLQNVDKKIAEVEKQRIDAFATLATRISSLANAEAELKKETSNLVTALRRPSVRGRWGEIQLKRVVELAGMVNYCDFVEQQSVTGDGKRIRPDLIINLPNERKIVVDAKTPLDAYIQSLEMTDSEAREAELKRHAGQIRQHIANLSTKAYWEQFDHAPEFVVMFLPGEMFFSAALEQEPNLIELGVEKRVLISTPTTLISLLRAVAYGWKQEQIAQSAREISNLGRDLYDRLRVLSTHFAGVGKNLERAMDSYNKTVGSFEGRVLVSARKFKGLGAATGQQIEPLETIDVKPRQLQACLEDADQAEPAMLAGVEDQEMGDDANERTDEGNGQDNSD